MVVDLRLLSNSVGLVGQQFLTKHLHLSKLTSGSHLFLVLENPISDIVVNAIFKFTNRLNRSHTEFLEIRCRYCLKELHVEHYQNSFVSSINFLEILDIWWRSWPSYFCSE